MNGHRALAGLSLLCALAFCALAASSASAADGKGTTQFTCVSGGGAKDFKDNHCNEGALPGSGAFGHVAVALNEKTATEFVQTAELVLHSTFAGLKTTITCKKVTGTGTQTNSEPSAGFHTVAGTGIKFVPSECTAVLGATACPVTVTFNSLISHDVENAHGFKMGIKFEPEKAGDPIAVISLGPCKATADKTILANLDGSFMGLPEGATLKFNEASTKSTLKFGGQQAFLTATLTVKRAGGNPITFTTTDQDRTN